MKHTRSGKMHYIFGIISLVIIIIAGTLMRLTSIAEGVLGIVLILFLAPVIYLWIRKTKKHDHGYRDSDFRHWIQKHETP